MNDAEKYITDEMRQRLRDVQAQGLQRDLRALAERIRSEAPAGTPDFETGIDWAVLYIENVANSLTR